MPIPFYQIDTFTTQLFKGNPAGVCPLEHWLSDDTMQLIAAENNLSETAFFVKEGEGFHIRWFTPTAEVDLCGHATLASAYVLYTHLDYTDASITFQSRSGKLTVTKFDNSYTLNFPVGTFEEIKLTEDLIKPFTIKPNAVYKGKSDYMFIFENEQSIADLNPDISLLKKLKARGVIVTAEGEHTDFVSRCFYPLVGIDEDPVTGSAHTTLIPYWANRLSKTTLTARQISQRGGDLTCVLKGDRVDISGQAVTYMIGNIIL